MTVHTLHGDAAAVLRTLPAASFQCCVTSPPYYGLRSYLPAGHPDKSLEIGGEATPDVFIARLVGVFAEVRRVLRDDGVLWANVGDSYAQSGMGGNPLESEFRKKSTNAGSLIRGRAAPIGTKPKDLIGIPWMLAFALRADGWYLRSDVIWSKPNPMPESVTDRPTCSHEHVFLLTKSATYFYDADAIRNPPSDKYLQEVADGYNGSDTKDFAGAGVQSASGTKARIIEGARKRLDKQRGHGRRHDGFNGRWDALTRVEQMVLGSNARNVWTIATKGYKGAHFAIMPAELAKRCILAGSKEGDHILDPFGGSGTTGVVADQTGRSATLIDLNGEYRDMQRARLVGDAGMFAEIIS